MDLGIENFATLSDGKILVQNSQFFNLIEYNIKKGECPEEFKMH